MKISIGSKIVEGPWGGGNLFYLNLKNYLISQGHEVVFDLLHSDIDIILLTDPRKKIKSSATFSLREIIFYKKFVNKNVRIIQRVNECDERKGTTGINETYLNASSIADHVVFVSDWLRKIYLKLGLATSKTSVIMSGSDKDIFFPRTDQIKKEYEKFKIVTHHWSSNINKGYNTYKKLDDLLNQKVWKNKIEFTYIGNISKEFELLHTKIIKPLNGKLLADELRKHHIYLTGSINEPSGNHHIEAALCGLPIIYYDSGGIPEYCRDFGISFVDNLEEALKNMIIKYDVLKNTIKSYPFNSVKMSQDYLSLFQIQKFKGTNSYSENKVLIFLFFKFIKFKNFLEFNYLTFIQSIRKFYLNTFRRFFQTNQ